MPAKWFCDDCGKEIWQGLSQNQKETETVVEMEKVCMCSDCVIKNGGYEIQRIEGMLSPWYGK